MKNLYPILNYVTIFRKFCLVDGCKTIKIFIWDLNNYCRKWNVQITVKGASIPLIYLRFLLTPISSQFSPTAYLFLLVINPCLINNGGCEGECINDMGRASCRCFRGHRLRADGKSCEGIHFGIKLGKMRR